MWEHEYKRWQASKFCYPELELYYIMIKKIAIHPWWFLAKMFPHLNVKISSIFSILMGCQPKFMMCNFQSSQCKLCNSRSKDDGIHILFDCEGLTMTRENAWINVIQTMPPSMVIEIQNMTSKDKYIYMMSCFGGSFVSEWTSIYIQIVHFVNIIYKKRAALYKEFEEGIT